MKKNPLSVKNIFDDAVKLLTWLILLNFEPWVHVFLMLSDKMGSAHREPLWYYKVLCSSSEKELCDCIES